MFFLKKIIPIFIIIEFIQLYYTKYLSFDLYKETEGEYYYGFVKRSHEGEKSVIIDTGSDYFAINCDEVKNFIKYENKDDGNSFELRFLENTEVLGRKIRDSIQLKGKGMYGNPVITNIGCIGVSSGIFTKSFANGIIGLNHDSDFLAGMESSFYYKLNLLFCVGTLQGQVDILYGEIKEENWDIQFNYITLFNTFAVKFGDIYLNEERIYFLRDPEINYTVNFDYGTTLLLLPEEIYSFFIKDFNSYCARNENNCGSLSDFEESNCIEFELPDENFQNIEELMSTFPIFKIKIEESFLIIYPIDYFFFENTKSKNLFRICLGIRSHFFPFIQIGNNSLKNKMIFIDRNTKTLKIKTSACNQVNYKLKEYEN